MIEVRATAAIAKPAAEVFDFIADMSNNPRWQKGMQSCEWTSDGPIAVGSTYDQVAGFLGKEIRTSFKVTEFDAGERIRIESTSGPLQLDIVRSVMNGIQRELKDGEREAGDVVHGGLLNLPAQTADPCAVSSPCA